VEGVLSNGGRCHWYASALPQLEVQARRKRSLKSQIEDFHLQAGRYPLDRAVVPRLLVDQREQPPCRGVESFLLRKVHGYIDDDDDTYLYVSWAG
jgi:hypothetical protein